MSDKQLENTAIKSSKNESENSPLLPRSPWDSQLAHMKVILKVKQALDKSQNLAT
ncbi:MAG: hypothetical protein QNJ47_18160 [Nostocaceae cyanobacterium]|nr:hypothetical protein [Nostocaceae cyanobacterium]